MLASAFDSLLNTVPARRVAPYRLLETPLGRIHVRDSGGTGPVVLMAPDGPNVVAHYDALIDRLTPRLRVVCFDLPGFGHSRPRWNYGHRLDEGAGVVLAVMDALAVERATLAFSCVNGFYAMAAARRAPGRIDRLLLSQTPSLDAMRAWTTRIVPKPLAVPLLGQALFRVNRRKAAQGWYKVALADKAQRPAFQHIADHALRHGACYCLAGVVQGVMQGRDEQLRGVSTPVTLIWGDADRSHAQTRAESLLDLLPQARIEHFADCGHFPDLENPARYAERLLTAVSA
jgi:pimeloyl-ACP methyl ester carboxylesterase